MRPLRAAAEQGELLSERQVLEHEVGVRSERCAKGTRQSEYEVHSSASLAEKPSFSLMIDFWRRTGAVRVPRRGERGGALRCTKGTAQQWSLYPGGATTQAALHH